MRDLTEPRQPFPLPTLPSCPHQTQIARQVYQCIYTTILLFLKGMQGYILPHVQCRLLLSLLEYLVNYLLDYIMSQNKVNVPMSHVQTQLLPVFVYFYYACYVLVSLAASCGLSIYLSGILIVFCLFIPLLTLIYLMSLFLNSFLLIYKWYSII